MSKGTFEPFQPMDAPNDYLDDRLPEILLPIFNDALKSIKEIGVWESKKSDTEMIKENQAVFISQFIGYGIKDLSIEMGETIKIKLLLNILPETKEYERENFQRMNFCYLHGKLEEDAGYDIFGLRYIPTNLQPGLYDCSFVFKKCTFFYWKVEEFPFNRGLVVYDDDKEGYDYAQKLYNEKKLLL